jgi:hypothetical protein
VKRKIEQEVRLHETGLILRQYQWKAVRFSWGLYRCSKYVLDILDASVLGNEDSMKLILCLYRQVPLALKNAGQASEVKFNKCEAQVHNTNAMFHYYVFVIMKVHSISILYFVC